MRTVDGHGIEPHPCTMKGEFTATIEQAPEGGYWAICAEAITGEDARAVLLDFP
jgi:hypothetical protein